MKPSQVIFVFCVISIFTFIACGIESQESTFKYRLQALDELSAKASGELKTAIIQEKASLEEKYSRLPAEENQRGEGLGLLNIESRDFISQMTKKLDELAGGEELKRRTAEKSEFASRLAKLSGDWRGLGMRLLITPDGTVEYERTAGGVKKSITGGTITRIGADSFDVKVLVASTTFRLDEPPRKEGASWKMKVDGIEVAR